MRNKREKSEITFTAETYSLNVIHGNISQMKVQKITTGFCIENTKLLNKPRIFDVKNVAEQCITKVQRTLENTH